MRTEPAPTTLAIDIGATHTRLAVVRGGTIGVRSMSPTAALIGSDGSVVDALVAAALDLARDAGGPAPQAVGIGLAAFVDATGCVLQAREFGIPRGSAVRDALTDAFGVPVAVDNDANLAALAEGRLGVAAGLGTVAVITLGTNIGLGLLVEGRILRGAHGAAGEAGLLLVPARDVAEATDGQGRIVDAGRLGRACSSAPAGYAHIEELVGGGALAAAAADGGAPDETATRAPADVPAGASRVPSRVLTRDAVRGPVTDRLADRALEGWALLIANLCALLDPELVVLTGGLAEDAAHLLPSLRRRVAELAPLPAEIRIGSVGPDAELLGADLSARSALVERAVGHARAGLSAQSRGGDR
ncbi:MAG TPA: ROK family protein [Candidatus Limnocylindrales bacterium]